jgi:hypothetical protein
LTALLWAMPFEPRCDDQSTTNTINTTNTIVRQNPDYRQVDSWPGCCL